MYDDPVLSRLTDYSVSDDQQEETNKVSLFLYDQKMLLKCIKVRVSKYTLQFYIDNIKNGNMTQSYWLIVLREIINKYSLNSMKLFLTNIENVDNISNKIIDLLYFIKNDLIEYFFVNKLYLKDYIPKDEFINTITNSDINIPYLFKWAMVYIDKESYDSFIDEVLRESSEYDYSDDV